MQGLVHIGEIHEVQTVERFPANMLTRARLACFLLEWLASIEKSSFYASPKDKDFHYITHS
ncbi:hypothetical protein PDESU_04273 [Pontiella desulfatans]|uniref:Uncharacterized protein n=1 Tax=Pontiella desulfatans TaxID=2750659 RepID=A0A6C2U6I5_PONDE|nr:hypothetical protein PDESU_04273 [Pontiella desulfatans]